MRKLYWLDDEAWSKIEPHLPRGRRGAHLVDDRRVISGIVHMLQSGARWRDCPVEYGPYTTVYNRFNRWSRQGIWHDIFKALAGHSGIYSSAAIDSTSVKRSERSGIVCVILVFAEELGNAFRCTNRRNRNAAIRQPVGSAPVVPLPRYGRKVSRGDPSQRHKQCPNRHLHRVEVTDVGRRRGGARHVGNFGRWQSS